MPWPVLNGVFLFLCALIFYYFSVLDIDYKKSSLLNLKPGPDAVEYFAQARALAEGQMPLIQLGRERLPSTFPPGYPALIVPWLKVLPAAESVLAPFRTNQTIGLFMLVATFAFYYYLRMPLAGGIAALLLATLPGFWTFARSSMSDTSGWLFYLLASMFAYLGLKEKVRWKIYVSAALLGLSMNLRLQSVFLGPLLLAMPLFPMQGGRWRWFYHCVGAGLVFLLASSPYLILNFIEFHSPLKLGGNFWYPPRHLFSLDFILTKNPAMFWKEFTLQPIGYFAANIFGTGTVFVPAFVLLILAGTAFLRVNRAVLCIAVADLTFCLLTASYIYPDGRYYLQLLMLLIPLAVLPVVWALEHLFVPKQVIAALGILVLFVAACLGYPSRSGYKTTATNRVQAWDALYFHAWGSESNWLQAEKNFAKRFRHKPGIVFSDIDPVYLNALWPDSFIAAPVDEKQLRRWSPTWHYGRAQATALAKYGLERSLPVYAIVVWRKEKEKTVARLPALAGYQWSEIPSQTSEAVLELVPVSF